MSTQWFVSGRKGGSMSGTKARREHFTSVHREFAADVPVHKANKPRPRTLHLVSTGVVFVIGILAVVWFFHLDRHGEITRLIVASGGLGIVISIVLMALFCVIPVPAEFLLILDMKVFGVWWGTLYSWIGTMVGCTGVFLLARYVAGGMLRAFIPEDKMEQVSEWVGKRGVAGLLLAHVIPLPFIVVNYVAGVIRSVRLWDFIWTSAIGGVPYYLGAALVFLGVSRKYMVWAVIGLIALVAIWVSGFWYTRRASLRKP